ncbi:hypothetical protein AX774_g7230, partial [Zancudomyces culisetae]
MSQNANVTVEVLQQILERLSALEKQTAPNDHMSVSEISDSANITAPSIVDAVDDDSVENFVVPRPTPSDLV